MTKNRSMKIAVLVLALALLTSCFVGSTFARYTSTGTGAASVEVATWAFEVNDTNIVDNGVVNFDLFDTVLDTDGGLAETDVVAGKIAPGTKGSFSFDLANTSEVTVAYTITLAADLLDMPIVFKTAGMDNYGTLAEVNAKLAGTLGFVGNTTSAATETVVTVEWQWPIGAEGADNLHAGKTLEVSATYKADQVD